MPEAKEGKKEEISTNLSGLEQAAVFLLSLGEQDAAQVLRHMGPKEVQRLGIAMAGLKNVTKTDVSFVLDRFLSEIGTHTALGGLGTDEYIRKTLIAALGEDKANTIIDRILLGASAKGLDTLKWMDAKSVADMIRFEHPQIQTIVLAYLEPDQSAEIMNQFPDKVRLDLMMRIATLESVHPAALQELNSIMERQFSGSSGSKSTEMGGIKKAADIMNFLETSVESLLMEGIKEMDEELAQRIQDLMFVFDNLAEVDDRGIQSLLREVSSEVLLLAMRGADQSVREKIFKNMSKRAAELMKDDLESMGPVKLSDVEGAQKEILSIASRMAEAGELVLGGKSGEEMI